MNPLVRYMGNQTQASPEEIAKVAVGATSVEDFLEKLYRDQEMGKGVVTMLDRAGTRKKMLKDLNDLRDLFGVEPLQDENKTDVQPEQKND